MNKKYEKPLLYTHGKIKDITKAKDSPDNPDDSDFGVHISG
ncbi:MAG: hypothetical protein ACPK7O_05140 [Methanobacterium sp.]